jgi:prolyl-tRNA editing enzyme YbaK/EbsC (Cys-tRNA(Pro) deacylase)
MLEDFLEVNEVKAELIDLRKEVSSLSEALQVLGLKKNEAIQAKLLLDSEEEGVLCLFPSNLALDLSKAEKVVGKPLKVAEEKQVLEITGYKKDFLPPLSIYGVKTLIDKKVLKKETVFSAAGSSSKLLKISSKELIKAAFNPIVEDITLRH